MVLRPRSCSYSGFKVYLENCCWGVFARGVDGEEEAALGTRE